jgi:hypothetical protein
MGKRWRAWLLALVLVPCLAVGTVVAVARSPQASKAVAGFLPPALVNRPAVWLVRTCARTPVMPRVGWCGNSPVTYLFGQPTPWCRYSVPLWRAEAEGARLDLLRARGTPIGPGMACPP